MMRQLPKDLPLILRTEAANQRKPPIDYAVAEDGLRMVVRPEPDIAMAELLEEAAQTLITARDDALEEAKQAVIRFRDHQSTLPGEVAYERCVAADDIADVIEALKGSKP